MFDFSFLFTIFNTASSAAPQPYFLTLTGEHLDAMVVLVDDNEIVPRVAADGGWLAELARQLTLRPELGVVRPVRVEQLYAVVRSVRHHDFSVLRKKKKSSAFADNGTDTYRSPNLEAYRYLK